MSDDKKPRGATIHEMAIECAAADLRAVFQVISKASMYRAEDGGDQVWPTFELDGAGAGLFEVASQFYRHYVRTLARAAMPPLDMPDVEIGNQQQAGEVASGFVSYLDVMRQAVSNLTPDQQAALEQIGAVMNGGGGGSVASPVSMDQPSSIIE